MSKEVGVRTRAKESEQGEACRDDHPPLVRGWVQTIRDMGKITFIDLRDHTGLLQVVVPGDLEIPKLGREYVVEIEGEVRERGERFRGRSSCTHLFLGGCRRFDLADQSQQRGSDGRQG